MSNKSHNNNVENKSEDTPTNNAVTSVEVLKGDDVISEDHHSDQDDKSSKDNLFDKDYTSNKDSKSDKDDKSSEDDKSSKDDKSSEDDTSSEDGKSSKDDKSSEDDTSNKDDTSNEDDKNTTIANIYQWATKLKDDFMSDKSKSDDKKSSDKKSDDDTSEDNKSDSDKSDKDDKYSATVANIYQWASKLKDDLKSEASGMTYGVSEKAVAMLLNKLVDGVDAELEAFDKKVEDSEQSDANSKKERQKIVEKKEKYQGMIDQLES